MNLHPLPHNKIVHWSILEVFADDNSNVAKMINFVFGKREIIMGKGENAGYQHFLFFPQCITKCFFLGFIKSLDCMVKS